jgi:nucleoside-diphosphate-sugar epimerase
MKILVTGAGGFLGLSVVERLLAHGEKEIRCFVRPATDRARLENLRSKYPDANLEYTVGNLAMKGDAARAVEDIDILYHLAAGTVGSDADTVLNTVVASKNLLEAFSGDRPKLVVLVSSFSVYGVATLPRGSHVNENTPLEPHPEKRDSYSYAKLRQELLFQEYQNRCKFELVIVRPGVIYGPGGKAFSSRVGLLAPGIFLHLGGSNILPLTYVDNCAEAIVLAGKNEKNGGEVYNVVDDDLPACRDYLRAYRKQVRKLRTLHLPYFMILLLSRIVEKYYSYSKGQLPLVFTPYKTKAIWGGNCFDNHKLKSIGWKPLVSIEEGMRRTFEWLKTQENNDSRE